MSIHRISLRGPWNITPLDLLDAPPVRQPLPEDWGKLAAISEKGVRLQRTFHRPTGLEHRPSVWIAITDLRGGGELRLNGHPLSVFQAEQPTDFRSEIGSLLAPNNHLEIELKTIPETSQTAQSPPTAVALEIEDEKPPRRL